MRGPTGASAAAHGETAPTAGACAQIEGLPAVQFDGGAFDFGADSRFKYVLIKAKADAGEVYLVRGHTAADYHADAAEATVNELQRRGIWYNVLGGGRIAHVAGAKTFEVYGHSKGFPWHEEFMHDVTADLCRAAFPQYTVSWHNDGY